MSVQMLNEMMDRVKVVYLELSLVFLRELCLDYLLVKLSVKLLG